MLGNKLRKLIANCFRPKLQNTTVLFNDLNSISPISRDFGFERGKPVDRYYIEKFIQSNKRFINGRVLEIAELNYSSKYALPDSKLEVLHFDNTNPKATIVGDLTKKETLPMNLIDCFICTQTFNFIYDVKKAIEGAHHLLNNNGIMLATVAGLTQISRYDMDRWGDYWRFTDKSIQNLLSEVGFKDIEITVYGNVLAAIALLQGISIEDLPNKSLLDVVDEDYQVLIAIKARK